MYSFKYVTQDLKQLRDNKLNKYFIKIMGRNGEIKYSIS